MKKVLIPGQVNLNGASGVQTSLRPIWKFRMAVQTKVETRVAAICMQNVCLGLIFT